MFWNMFGKHQWLSLSAALLLGVSLAPGCASWDTIADSDEFGQDFSWDEPLRTPTTVGEQVGIDDRAREIERSLGVK